MYWIKKRRHIMAKKIKATGNVILKWAIILLSATVLALYLTGCNTGLVSSSVETTTATIAFDGTPKTVTIKNDVLAMRGTVLVNTEVDKANISWGDVKINVGGYATAGDAKSLGIIGTAITRGIIAWATSGGSEVATQSAVIASLIESQSIASTNTPAIK